MKEDIFKQIMLGSAIGILILLLQGFGVMINDYTNTRIIATDYVPYGQMNFMSNTIYNYVKNGYECEYELHWLSGGGYQRGEDWCHNENETINIWWDFDNSIERIEIWNKDYNKDKK